MDDLAPYGQTLGSLLIPTGQQSQPGQLSEHCSNRFYQLKNLTSSDITKRLPSKSYFVMEQHAFKNVYNCLNTNIYSYLETSGGQSSNLYLNVVPFLTPSVN